MLFLSMYYTADVNEDIGIIQSSEGKLITESCHGDNFVNTDATGGCRYYASTKLASWQLAAFSGSQEWL